MLVRQSPTGEFPTADYRHAASRRDLAFVSTNETIIEAVACLPRSRLTRMRRNAITHDVHGTRIGIRERERGESAPRKRTAIFFHTPRVEKASQRAGKRRNL